MGIKLGFNDEDRIQQIVSSAICINDTAWLVQQIVNNFNPEDLFTESDLEEWAQDHGYTKEG